MHQFPLESIKIQEVLNSINEVCKTEPLHNPTEIITDEDIKQASKHTKGLVISTTDKNNGCLVAECPLGYYLRIEKELINTPNYTLLPDNQIAVLHKMKLNYKEKKFGTIKPWGDGYLPEAYCNPKQKDLNKTRVISAANALPHKKLLQPTGGILHWLLRTIPTKNFTLHKMNTLPTLLILN